MEKEPLIEAATAVREFAFAPYSSFKVGAAIQMEDGEVLQLFLTLLDKEKF